MAKIMNRRAALAALATLPALGVPAVALAAQPDVLTDLIAQHRKAREALIVAMNELEAVSPGYHTSFPGIGDREYILGAGQDEIKERIGAHFEEHAIVLRRIDQLSPGSASAARAALERERDAALARLDAIFAPRAVADERYRSAGDEEFYTLTEICSHRCRSTEELVQKFRYLKEYSDELQSEQYDAIFESFLPQAESDEA